MTDTSRNQKPMSETPEEIEYELRGQIGSIWSGGRLFIGMYTFLLASLAFSYFYLRAANNGLLWRPHNITAPTAYGWTIWGLSLVAAVLVIFGQRRLRSGNVLDWQVAGWVGVACGLVALAAQIWEFTAVPFYPGSSGYASTFIGWSVINIGTLAGATYWLETTLARSHRMRRESGTASPELSSAATARLFRANVASMTYFWGFVAVSGALFLAMFYLL
jgi:heme/copper-type cytochrome/quinol oxidase subunit 3